MEYKELYLEQLAIDPTNYRGYYEGVDSLAHSIRDHGLLQNLVVAPLEGQPDRYIVKAGNRRLLAINKLVETGERSPEQTIMCLVDDDGNWADIVENMHREDVPMWRTGFRFIELMEGGLTQLEIAARSNVSNGTVSNYTSVARNLHPEVMTKLERMGHKSVTKTQLIVMARCINESLEPVLADQLALLEKFLSANSSKRIFKKRTPRADLGTKSMVYDRFMRIVHGYEKTPPQHVAVVDAVIKYLKGDVRHPQYPR
jgi:ParB/RepB/Spo0J family partition protein